MGTHEAVGQAAASNGGAVAFHPIANIFPLLQGEDLSALVADIATNGQIEPIWLHPDGRILDGRNRYRACLAAGVEPIFRTYEGDTDTDALVSFVVSLNVHRRHLRPEQRAAAAAAVIDMFQEQARERQGAGHYNAPQYGKNPVQEKFTELDKGQSRDQAGKLFNISGPYVDTAVKAHQQAPEVFGMMQSGRANVPAARLLIDLDESERGEVLHSLNGRARIKTPQVEQVIKSVRRHRQPPAPAPPAREPGPLVRQVLLGDCLDILPELDAGSVQLIITSPPYPGQRGFSLPVREWTDWFWKRLEQMVRVLHPETGVLALNVMFRRKDGFFDTRLFSTVEYLFESANLFMIDVYPWVKTNPVPVGNLNRSDIPAWEPVFVSGRSPGYTFNPTHRQYSPKTIHKSASGKPRTNGVNGTYAGGHSDLDPRGARQTNVLMISSSGDQNRPRAAGGSFPAGLPEAMIKRFSNGGDVVLDPFCGAGTTLRAAADLGRRWIGIDNNPAEVERARQWMASQLIV